VNAGKGGGMTRAKSVAKSVLEYGGWRFVAVVAVTVLAVVLIVLPPLSERRDARNRQICQSRLAIARSSTDTLTALLSKPQRWVEDCQWWLSR